MLFTNAIINVVYIKVSYLNINYKCNRYINLLFINVWELYKCCILYITVIYLDVIYTCNSSAY